MSRPRRSSDPRAASNRWRARSARRSCRRSASAPGICCDGRPPRSGPPADPRSALTRRLAMAALVTGNQATTSVIERGLNDADAEVRRFAAAAAGDRRAHRRSRSRHQDRAGRQGAARPARGAARLGPAFSEDVVRADSRRAEGCQPARACCRRSISSAQACPAAESPAADLTRHRRLAERPRRATWHAPAHAIVSLARAAARCGAHGAAAIRAAPDLAGADVCRASRRRAGVDRRCSTRCRPMPTTTSAKRRCRR